MIGRASTSRLAAGLTIALAAVAWGQTPPQGPVSAPVIIFPGIGPLEVVEEAVGDVGSLDLSLRYLESGLGFPVGFEQVYRVPDDPDHLMRASGGLFAVFPRSQYDVTSSRKSGVRIFPVVPADTVFHIGPPGWSKLPDAAARGQMLRMDLRLVPEYVAEGPRLDRGPERVNDYVNTRLTIGDDLPDLPRRPTFDEPDPGPIAEIVSDAAYRSRRIRELMDRAAQAARGPSSSGSLK
jgi:hypothetical protein